jgi:hypothetical protein
MSCIFHHFTNGGSKINTTDAQFQHLLSLAEVYEILRKKERAAIMLLISLILDKQKVCEILKTRQ